MWTKSGHCLQVSWVQPRVLTLPQVAGLKGRLENWISKVNAAALTLEQESADVV
jgi:26S proteasome regulatory subunit N9